MDFDEIIDLLSIKESIKNKNWTDLNSKEINEIYCQVNDKLFFSEMLPDITHKVVSRIFISRISCTNIEADFQFFSPVSDVIIQLYISKLTNKGKHLFDKSIFLESELPYSKEKFITEVKNFINSSSCSEKHPIFSFLKKDATFHQLSEYLWAENLCDLNFVNILAFLMQNLRGSAGIEIATNYYDEIGCLDLKKFHGLMRRTMMDHVGLPKLNRDWNINSYLKEEHEHFNAYCSNGLLANRHFRLIGMMYATEYLVPSQQDYILSGWKRVGLLEEKMEYVTEHIVSDIDHSSGWEKNVILPLLLNNYFIQKEILIGVVQHVDILTRFYDQLFISLNSGVELRKIN